MLVFFAIFTEPFVGDNFLVAMQSGYYPLRAGWAHDMRPGMKLQKQATVPKIEIDLSRIQQLSQERDGENWEFRSWLKQYAPDDIDGLVKTLSQKYFALIDCTQCANCCTLHVEFKKSELHAIAKTFGQSIEAFARHERRRLLARTRTENPPRDAGPCAWWLRDWWPVLRIQEREGRGPSDSIGDRSQRSRNRAAAFRNVRQWPESQAYRVAVECRGRSITTAPEGQV
jgi:hypothetical protein